MRLDFNVLWVEDQPERIASQSSRIAAGMANEGFQFCPRHCRTMDEVVNAIADNVFTDEVDLILVDWDLGNQQYGDDAIDRIREIVRFKDVVFYSGERTVVELRRMAFDKNLEGVFCSGRPDLVDEVLGVFESLVKKVLDLDHTRGIVMGATSDIEHMINSCLSLAHGKLDENGKAELVKNAMGRIERKVENLVKQGKKLTDAPDLDAVLKAHMLFTADDRLRLLASILKMADFAAHAERITTIESYRAEVVVNRNQLGHVVLRPEGKPAGVAALSGQIVDLEQMRTLRRLILGLRADFRTLLQALEM